MSHRPLTRRLEEETAPQVDLPEARARLRRDLLSRFEAERRRRPPYLFRAAAAVVLASAVSWVALGPKETTAMELVRDLQQSYDRHAKTGPVHYLRQIIETAGRPPLEEERWTSDDQSTLRVLYRDPASGELLGHSIVKGATTYRKPDDRIRVERRILGDTSLPGVSARPVRLAMVILPEPVAGLGGEDLRQALLLPEAYDRRAFERRTPREIVAQLAARSDVLLRRIDTDRGAERDTSVHRLELRHKAGQRPIKIVFPARYLEELQWFSDKLNAAEIMLRGNGSGQQQTLGDDVLATSLEARETLHIDAQTARLRDVTISVYEEGREIYRASKTFVAEAWVAQTPGLFDPETYGLSRDAAGLREERP